MENIQQDILEATLILFNDRGLDFTMNDIAKSMHIAKKTFIASSHRKKSC